MRFLTEDGIDNDDYNEVKSDLEAKIANCEKELKDCSRDLSNLVEYTDVALKIASTLGSTWDKMDFKVCQKIQNLAFPKGIKRDGEKRCYRTDGMNEFFRQIGLLRGSARGEGIKETDTDCSVSGVSSGGRTFHGGIRTLSPPTESRQGQADRGVWRKFGARQDFFRTVFHSLFAYCFSLTFYCLQKYAMFA